MRLGEELGLVNTHKQLDQEQSDMNASFDRTQKQSCILCFGALEFTCGQLEGVMNCIWGHRMLQMYIRFIMHKLHPSRVQVEFWMGEVDLANNVVGNFLKPETEYYIVCAKLVGRKIFATTCLILRSWFATLWTCINQTYLTTTKW